MGSIASRSRVLCRFGATSVWATRVRMLRRYRQSDAPSGTFKTITASSLYSCGVRTDDTITCWGTNLDEQIDAPPGTFKTDAP